MNDTFDMFSIREISPGRIRLITGNHELDVPVCIPDIRYNSKKGLEEVIYLLQKYGEMRISFSNGGCRFNSLLVGDEVLDTMKCQNIDFHWG